MTFSRERQDRPSFLHIVGSGEQSVGTSLVPAQQASRFLGGNFPELAYAFNISGGMQAMDEGAHFFDAIMAWMEQGEAISSPFQYESFIEGHEVPQMFQEKQLLVPLRLEQPYVIKLSSYTTVDGRKGFTFAAQAQRQVAKVYAVEQNTNGNWEPFAIVPGKDDMGVIYKRHAKEISTIHLRVKEGIIPPPSGGGGGTLMPVSKAA